MKPLERVVSYSNHPTPTILDGVWRFCENFEPFWAQAMVTVPSLCKKRDAMNTEREHSSGLVSDGEDGGWRLACD
jgi:hypothetical protein